MKYLCLASVAALLSAATVSAGPLGPRGDDTCPKGYTASVYYKTIYLEPSTTATPVDPTVIPSPTPVTVAETSTEPTVTPSSTPVVVASQTPSVVEQVPSSASSSSLAEISSTEAVALLPTSSLENVAAVETTTAPLIQPIVEQTSTTQDAPETTAETTTAPVIQALPKQTTTTKAAATTAAAAVKAVATTSSSTGGNSGKATFYGGNVSGGTCSFSGYSLPSTLFGTALSLERWDDSANCGRCVSVTGPNGNSVKAMVSRKYTHHTGTTLTIPDRRPMPRMREQPPRSLPECLRRTLGCLCRHY
jgi:hypothetical protein